MTLERRIRLIAGLMILASLALAHWVSPWFLWLTAFVGANLVQSSLTRWCLMEDILRRQGWDGSGRSDRSGRSGQAGQASESGADSARPI
jgi:hypothetical protein